MVGEPVRLETWRIVPAVVVAHPHYGLRVRVPSGEVGVVDSVHIADELGLPPDRWPPVGSEIEVVAAGSTTVDCSSVGLGTSAGLPDQRHQIGSPPTKSRVAQHRPVSTRTDET